MRGNTNFKGVILVLGEGKLIRDGGGNGEILVESRSRRSIARQGGSPRRRSTRTAVVTSTIQYDSSALSTALGSGQNVSGIREF